MMEKISQLIQARYEDVARTISEEMGSPISFSIMGQVFASTMVLDYYTNLAREYEFEEFREGALGPVLVRREPVGVAGCIVPWNVPLFTIMLKMGPALASGSTVVLKPAPETPLDAYLLADVIEEVGLPPGVVNIVAAGRGVGEHLVTHRDVDKISFTGSTAAGKRIGALCGAQLKRCTLELGGKSAAIILDDADLATAIPGLLPNSIMNNGQACIAQTRILASRARYDDVVDALAAAMSAAKVGAPLDPETVVGPLVASRQRDRVEGFIAKGREEGARVVVGGGRPAEFENGLVRRAHGVRRRRQQDDDRAGGDLRAGARGDPVRVARRRGAHRQRLRLRARGLGVDVRRGRRASTSPSGCARAPTASTARR